MNTQKQIVAMVVLMFLLAGGCAAYTAVDLPYRAEIQEDYQLSESVERGSLLFANNCRGCHGDRGQGGIGLPLNIDTYKSQVPLELEANRAKLRTTLYCGRMGTIMQPWINTRGGALNNIQIEHLIDLITDPEGVGWEHAAEFSRNLNHETVAVVGGDTPASIAKLLNIGVADLEDLNPRYGHDDVLPKGTTVNLPPNSQFPDGRQYETTKDNETLQRIAESQRVGEAILIDLNAESIEQGRVYSFNHDPDRNTFDILVDGRRVVGLFPGSVLTLPSNILYEVAGSDSIKSIVDQLGVEADDLRDLNPELADFGDEDGLESLTGFHLNLPALGSYVVQGQSVADLAAGFAGLSDGVQQFAEENDFDPTHVLRIGQTLSIPPESWGVLPSGTPNDGRACIEHAVPASVFEQLSGGGGPPEPPAEISESVEILSHSNDWQVIADGVEQEINKGAVSVQSGNTIAFRNVVGIHTITVNGEKQGEDFRGEDVREITFDEPGSYRITCDYHPDMLAWVFVQ